MVIDIGRGDAAVSVSMEGSFVETLGGKPVSMESKRIWGKMPLITRCTYGTEEIQIESIQGEHVTSATKPMPEETWLPPAAAAAFVRKRLEAGAQEIALRTIDPMSGSDPALITRRDIRKMSIEAMGKTIPAYRCITTSSATPGVEITEYLDEQGIPVRSQASMGGLAVTIVAAKREVAEQKGEPPELMLRTFVKPDKPIAKPRSLRRAVYILSVPGGEGPEITSTAIQTVEPLGDGRVRVRIDTAAPRPAEPADAEDRRFRDGSPLINSEDPVVQGLAREALLQAGQSPLERAQAMRRFVHDYIDQKDLGIGFASASEVARGRQGDCTEHATLLAAMLRADGIPSRVASGLIYADQFAGERRIFGYHMWTQALLDVEGALTWLDLDATMPTSHFDATHITLATSPLADADPTSSFTGLISLIGRLQIKVERAE
jgi:hypothetical protein